VLKGTLRPARNAHEHRHTGGPGRRLVDRCADRDLQRPVQRAGELSNLIAAIVVVGQFDRWIDLLTPT
jgi:hypothetical protein